MVRPSRQRVGPLPLVFLVLLSAGWRATAQTQLGARLSAVSDYRWRGESLSSRHAAMMGSVSVDQETGWFAALMGVNVCRDGRCGLATEWDLGYAHRWTSSLSWEAGLIRYAYPKARDGGRYDYTEGFVGVSGVHYTARLFHATRYFQDSPRADYLDLHAALPVRASWVLRAHAGHLFLGPVHDPGLISVSHSRSDFSVGVAKQGEGCTLALDWWGMLSAHTVCPGDEADCAKRWVATLSYAW